MRLKLLEKCGILFASHKERSLGRDTKRQVVSLYTRPGKCVTTKRDTLQGLVFDEGRPFFG